MIIVIPTYMRESAQRAFKRLPESVRSLTILYTHSGRADALREHNADANIVDLGVTDGIADVRQKILEHALANGHDKVLMMDDLVTVHRRKPLVEGESPKFAHLTEDDWMELLATLDHELDTYPMVTVPPRHASRFFRGTRVEVVRACSFYALNARTLHTLGVRFDGMYRKNPGVRLFEDVYLILSLFSRSLPNLALYDYAFSHPHGKPGGNSSTRSRASLEESCRAIVAEFPAFVRPIQLSFDSWSPIPGEAPGTPFPDVRIRWRDCYQYGRDAACLS